MNSLLQITLLSLLSVSITTVQAQDEEKESAKPEKYSHQVDEKDLLQIKELIGRYFANRLTRLADDAWERNG